MTHFSRSLLAAFDRAKILGVRAGADRTHRFTGVWVVVVEDRVFARSWGLKREGWYTVLDREGVGAIQLESRLIRVRARSVRGDRLLDAIEQGYAAKYNTPASMKWVRGFRTKRRRAATIEFLPATSKLAD